MKYTKEELSPTKVKVVVNVDAQEINAAIDAGVAMQQKGITMSGFRKGHVPAGLIEKRFKGQIYHDAANDLTNVHINKILAELKLVPVTGLNITPTPIEIERDKDIEYTVEFEHMPNFELPDYEGLEVEQTRVAEATPEEIDKLVEGLRKDRGKMAPVEGTGPAKDGEFVNIDFSVVVDGKEEQSVKGIEYEVGQVRAFAPLDELVRSVKLNESGEKETTFPEDFIAENLRGKTGTMHVHVYAIKAMKYPTDEELLTIFKKGSMDELRKSCNDVVVDRQNVLARSEAQNKLLEKLIKMVDFPLPEALVEGELAAFVQREQQRAQCVGKKLSDEQIKEVREKNREQAERQVKSYVLLRKIAEKEGLEVSERELQFEVANMARRMSDPANPINPQDLYKYYAENGMLFSVRDQLLINKAVEAIYAKAKVTMVEPKPTACASCAQGSDACSACAHAAEASAAAEPAAATEAAPAAEADAGKAE